MVFLFSFMHRIKHDDQCLCSCISPSSQKVVQWRALFQVLGWFANTLCTEDVVTRHTGLKCQSNEATDLWMNVKEQPKHVLLEKIQNL